MKSVRIPGFSCLYFPAFWLSTEKYGPESFRIRTLFTQWKYRQTVLICTTLQRYFQTFVKGLKMKLFAYVVNDWKPLNTSAKCSILYVFHGCEFISVSTYTKINNLWFCADFKRNGSYLICLNSVNIRSEIRRTFLTSKPWNIKLGSKIKYKKKKYDDIRKIWE